jgi:pyrroloquinoline quinone biosynthesis protein D
MSTATPRLHPKARMQRDEVRGREVLLYPEGLVTLNATGVEILALCDGERTLAEIVATLERRYGATGLERDIVVFLEGLAAKGLVLYGP